MRPMTVVRASGVRLLALVAQVPYRQVQEARHRLKTRAARYHQVGAQKPVVVRLRAALTLVGQRLRVAPARPRVAQRLERVASLKLRAARNTWEAHQPLAD